MRQATEFLDESEALCVQLAPLSEADFETPTQFKDWTINNIIRRIAPPLGVVPEPNRDLDLTGLLPAAVEAKE